MKNIGLVGCGNIAETYFRSQEYFNNIKFVSCADINEETAKKCAEKYNINSQSVDDLMKDDNVDIVLNLTIPAAHYDVIKKTLNAGNHSYCEKQQRKRTHRDVLFNDNAGRECPLSHIL